MSRDYAPNRIVIRDHGSVPEGRVLCVIARENEAEAELIAQNICDLLNKQNNHELDPI